MSTVNEESGQVSWQERIDRTLQIDGNKNMGPLEKLLTHVQAAAEFYERDIENGCK